MAWFSAGPQTNPADATVLADTGAIASGNNTGAVVVVTANAQANVIVEQRNAANNATVQSQFVRIPANDTRSIDFGSIQLAPSERLRVIQSGALTGVIHVSITY